MRSLASGGMLGGRRRRPLMRSTTLLPPGSPGLIGQRDSANRCVFKVDNGLARVDPRFGWGQEYAILDLRGRSDVTDVVVGVLANTHGWGTCELPTPTSFLGCRQAAWAQAWVSY
jgi:hypothetical protein